MTGGGHACGMSEGKCPGHSYKCGPAVGHVLRVKSQHLGGANAVGADEPSQGAWAQRKAKGAAWSTTTMCRESIGRRAFEENADRGN